MAVTNWAGNLTFRADEVRRPGSVDELRQLLADEPSVRVLGSRHSFSAIADGEVLVALDGLPDDVEVDREASTVTLPGAMTYGALAEHLHEHDLALHNMASLPHISVAGAVATATHGSGVDNGNLATAVAALELVTAEGELVRLARGDEGFDGAVVGLGALGAVTRVTLDVEPAYDIAQHVVEEVPWSALEGVEGLLGLGYSVSVFTRWGEHAGQVWVKERRSANAEREVAADLSGVDLARLPGARPAVASSIRFSEATFATEKRHPILGVDPQHTTAQLGVPGRWSDRLPHFRMDHTPSKGDELQSEWLVPADRADEAVAAVREVADRVVDVLMVSELRWVAADTLWLSPQHGTGTLGVHCTWEPDPDGVDAAIAAIHEALDPLGARPHWGKLSHWTAEDTARAYPRLDDFLALRERLDPRGVLVNDWFRQNVA